MCVCIYIYIHTHIYGDLIKALSKGLFIFWVSVHDYLGHWLVHGRH